MRVYRFHGAKLTHRELWRMSKGNPLAAMIGWGMKWLAPAALDTVNPHSSEGTELAEADIPDDHRQLMAPVLAEAEAAGFLQVYRMRHPQPLKNGGKAMTIAWYLVHRDGQCYVPLLQSVASGAVYFTDQRFAVITFAEPFAVLSTSRLKPIYEPPPYVAYVKVRSGTLTELVTDHLAMLRDRTERIVRLDADSLRRHVTAYNDASYANFVRRGLASEVYDDGAPASA